MPPGNSTGQAAQCPTGRFSLGTSQRRSPLTRPGVPRDLVFKSGRVSAKQSYEHDGASFVTPCELAQWCPAHRVDPTVFAGRQAEAGTIDAGTSPCTSFPDYSYGTHAAEVEADVGTGEVTVSKYAATCDVGRAISAMRIKGKIQGGAMQRLSFALMEENVLEERRNASSHFSSYLIPTFEDTLDIQVEIVESGEEKGSMSVRKIGVLPIGNVAGTIAIAVTDVIGRRPSRLPMTPERVLDLLDASLRMKGLRDDNC